MPPKYVSKGVLSPSDVQHIVSRLPNEFLYAAKAKAQRMDTKIAYFHAGVLAAYACQRANEAGPMNRKPTSEPEPAVIKELLTSFRNACGAGSFTEDTRAKLLTVPTLEAFAQGTHERLGVASPVRKHFKGELGEMHVLEIIRDFYCDPQVVKKIAARKSYKRKIKELEKELEELKAAKESVKEPARKKARTVDRYMIFAT